jgi:hypothetical protein
MLMPAATPTKMMPNEPAIATKMTNGTGVWSFTEMLDHEFLHKNV